MTLYADVTGTPRGQGVNSLVTRSPTCWTIECVCVCVCERTTFIGSYGKKYPSPVSILVTRTGANCLVVVVADSCVG